MALGIVAAIAANVNGVIINLFTGHLTKANKGLFDLLFHRKSFIEKSKNPALQSIYALLAFLCGVVWGKVLIMYIFVENDDNITTSFLPTHTLLCACFALLLILHDDVAPDSQKLVRQSLIHTRERAMSLRQSRFSFVSGVNNDNNNN